MRAVNLIPVEHRSGGGPVGGKSEGAAFIVLGLLGGLAILAGLYGLARHEISSREGQAATIGAEAQAAQARASRLAPYASFVAMRNQRTQAVEQLVDSRFDWAHAFHELGRVLPDNVALSTVTGKIESGSTAAASTPASPSSSSSSASSSTASSSAAAASSVSSATSAGGTPTFTLSGCSISQGEVAQMLERLRLMDGVSNVELQSSTKPDAGGAGGGSGGTCAKNDPAFAVQVTFAPLPAASAASPSTPGSAASATTVSENSATGKGSQ